MLIFTCPRTSYPGKSTCPAGSMYESDMAIPPPCIVAVSFLWRKPLTNFITCCIEYAFPWVRFKLATLVVMGTDYAVCCKSNHETFTIMTTTCSVGCWIIYKMVEKSSANWVKNWPGVWPWNSIWVFSFWFGCCIGLFDSHIYRSFLMDDLIVSLQSNKSWYFAWIYIMVKYVVML